MSGLRHLVSIDDLSLADMQALFEQAKSFAENLASSSHICRGLISASLFYEASTRTRLSFESAMLRLGGGVISAADMSVSSASKGESLADTVRVVSGGYADLIVLRHPGEGASALAAQTSSVPVINAGDGAHEHPTQTLCDLYTLWIEKGRIEGLDVVLAGDLRYSRTIHSFIYALARFGANVVCVPHPGLELPDYVVQRLREEYGAEPVRADASRLGEIASSSDAAYITPRVPHQLSLFTEASGLTVDRVDAVYMTRPQTERFADSDKVTPFAQMNTKAMSVEPLRHAVVMHPLPRRDEISSDLDNDPRSLYFKQASRGVPMRMALLAALLGRVDLPLEGVRAITQSYRVPEGENPCANERCISNTETRHIHPSFRLASRIPLRANCAYCSRNLLMPLVGCSTTRVVHAADSAAARKIRPEHLVFFRDLARATALGYAVPRGSGA
jgi:aspartate carbamoyltransferase catalytic subunit